MSKLSNYLEDALLKHLFRNTALAMPAETWLALYTTDPTDADTGTEVTGGAYSRMRVYRDGATAPFWTAPATHAGGGMVVDNNTEVTYPEATANWGTITHVGVRTAPVVNTAWAASTAYSLGTRRIPTTANGFFYEVTTAGTSGATQPTWPTTEGQTVTDGTVVWTTKKDHLLMHGALAASEQVLTGRVFRFKAGDFDLILE